MNTHAQILDDEVKNQFLIELIAGLDCTSLQRRSGLRQNEPAPATYPIAFLHCLPDSVQTTFREKAALVLAEAHRQGPLTEPLTNDQQVNTDYSEWLLLEARAALASIQLGHPAHP